MLVDRTILFFSIGVVVIFVADQGIIFNMAYPQSRVNITLDSSGIPIVDYGCVNGLYIGPQKNPLTVALHSMIYYDSYNRTNNDIFLQKFLNSTDWLVENSISKGNYSSLQYQFPWPLYDLQPPWQSSMAQGLALEALIKAHEITGDQKYLDTAKSLLNAFYIEVEDGGVTYKTPEDGWWYEEFAGKDSMEPHVLNGMANALLSIYKYYQYTQDPSAKYLFDQGVIALERNLPRYEYADGEYSTRDILNNTVPTRLNYHLWITNNLGKLHDITGNEVFQTYHDKWIDYKLPTKVEQRLMKHYNTAKPDILFGQEDGNQPSKLSVQNIGNASGDGVRATFKIKGNSENKPLRLTSGDLYLPVKNVSVNIGEKIRPYTNLQISLITLPTEKLEDEKTITFVHGPVSKGWMNKTNYYSSVEFDSSKFLNTIDLFSNDGYVIVKEITIDVPVKTCLDSMEFGIDLN